MWLMQRLRAINSIRDQARIDQIPLLLTSSAVAHDRNVVLVDTAERVRLTLESIAQWRKIRPKAALVVCDGSSYDFKQDVARLFPDSNIECLSFENPQDLVQKYGRGYGEGEIVKFALENSHYIQTAGCFAKCSAKLWVSNFDAAMSAWNGRMLSKGVFLNVFTPFKPTVWLHTDTRFYVANTDFYQTYFLNAHHLLGINLGDSLEECFKQKILENNLTQLMFQRPPLIEGVGGGIGRAYRTPLHRRLKELLRLNLVRRNYFFSKLF